MLVRGRYTRRGKRTARLTMSRRPTRTPADDHAAPSDRRPPRTSVTVLATRYAASTPVASARPWVRWAAATCPHATAVRTPSTSRRGHVVARRNQAAPASMTAVHARAPENGRDSETHDPATPRARARPPTVAAGLGTSSTRRKP